MATTTIESCTMRIKLIDFDSKIPNLALMRLSSYHKANGDKVSLLRGSQSAELFDAADKYYLSCVFRWNKKAALNTVQQLSEKCIAGGTGLDITSTLPAEVEQAQPDYSIYPDCDYAFGFISRGCIRKCPWCVVPRKEGGLKRVATAQEITGNRKKAIFIDNNFLALPDYEKDLQWLAENKIVIDFNQALDARLVDDKAARLLAQCTWYPGIRLSLDSDGMIGQVKKAIDNLAKYGVQPNTIRIFTLIGFSGLESDLERLFKVHEWGAAPFPMGFRDVDTGDEPAKGWDKAVYKKYRRLILRMPHAKSVWDDFRAVVTGGVPTSHAPDGGDHPAQLSFFYESKPKWVAI